MSDGQSAAGAAAASQAQSQQTTNTLAGVTSGAQAVAGLFGAWSAYRAGKFNSKVDLLNAKVADLQAKDAIRRGEVAAERQRQIGRRTIGAQRAGFAGQGVMVDQDTAAQVVSDTERAVQQDVQTIRVNAALEAWGYQVNATDSRAKATIAKREGSDRAAETLLTSSAHAADTYRSLTR